MAARRSYGTGSLWQREDSAGRLTWYGKFSVNGKPRKRAIGPVREPGTKIGLTKPEAEKRLRKLQDEAVPDAPSESYTIQELADLYARELVVRGKKESYIKGSFWSNVRVWLAPFFGDTPISAITSADIKDLVALMRQGERPNGKKVRPLVPKTISNIIWSTLSSMMNWAREEGWLTHNPYQGLRAPDIKKARGRIKFFEADEIAALVRNARPGDYAESDAELYLVAAETGLRQGELLAVRWMDVDWKAKRLRVAQSWSPKIKDFTEPKSEESHRSLPMADEVIGALDRQHRRATNRGPRDLVFADLFTGGPQDPHHVYLRYKEALKAAGLDTSHTFHHLRHTFGTRMAAVGTPMRTLQHWMGHRNISTTEKYADYAPAPEHERQLISEAFRIETIEVPVHEVAAAAVASWLREHRPDIYEQAEQALIAA